MSDIFSIGDAVVEISDLVSGVLDALPNSTIDTISDNAPYDVYEIECTTTYDTGFVQMPGTGVGASGGASAVVQVSGGMMQLVCTWVAGRTGEPPVLPSFASGTDNIVPLRGSIVCRNTVPSADGESLVYMISGYYVYAVLDPSLYELVAPVPPFLSTTVQQSVLTAAKSWYLWGFQGAAGSNPFITNEYALNTVPEIPTAFSAPLADAEVEVVASEENTTSPLVQPVNP